MPRIPLYRRILGYGLMAAGLAWAGRALTVASGPAQGDAVFMDVFVALAGALIRWQHVRVW